MAAATPAEQATPQPNGLLPVGPYHSFAGRLPAPLSSLVGREREVAAVGALLRDEGGRLVTLTGPGGVGKTRLALRAAEAMAADFADGVAFVPLAAIRDPALVLPAVAAVLGVRESGERSVAEGLIAALCGRRLLLVLDNLEQVLAAAPRIAELLAACPGLKVLATSRALLRVSGERGFPVAPLGFPIPSDGAPPPVADVARAEAVRLFVERAEAAYPDFVLTEVNAAEVTGICRRLDGLPLAIELAAARIKLLPPDVLLARLERRLPLLAGGPRDAPQRLRTMRDAIGWSYDLLSPEEQALFRRLAVFAGGFTPTAVEAVINADDDLGIDVLDGVASLVEASLLHPEGGAEDKPRYGMLETVREFAAEIIGESDEADEVRRRHAAYFLRMAKDARTRFEGPGRSAARDWVAREHDNLRAALGWAVGVGDAETAQGLAAELARFWVVLGNVGEGRGWLDRVVAMAGPSSPAMRVDALCWAAQFADLQNEPARAVALAAEALALARESGYRLGLAMALHELGQAAHWRGDLGEAAARYEEALALFRELGEPVWEGVTLRHLGVVAADRRDLDQATAYHREALAVWRRLDHPWGVPAALRDLAHLALLRGEAATALPLYRESLERWQQLGEKLHVAECFWGLARVAVASGRAEWAARLLGAAEALHVAIGVVPLPDLRARFAQEARDAKGMIGEAPFAAAWDAGRALAPQQAIAEAIGVAVGAPGDGSTAEEVLAPAATDRCGLTDRELEVLRLLVVGRSNPEIADALFVGRGTVRTHVSSILAKLGAVTRTEAADLARRRGLLGESRPPPLPVASPGDPERPTSAVRPAVESGIRNGTDAGPDCLDRGITVRRQPEAV